MFNNNSFVRYNEIRKVLQIIKKLRVGNYNNN